MKNITKYFLILIIVGITYSCNHDENETVPDFLKGTEYGVLFNVNVTSSKEVSVADINAYSLTFDVSYKGDKRPVKSVIVNKVYVDNVDGESSVIEQETITDFPKAMALTSTELVSGISGLSVGDLESGDSFNINFIINYEDGKSVTRFGEGMPANFIISIID